MRAITLHPERFVVEERDPEYLWEIVLRALYLAEAEAERVALADALPDFLRGKSAAAALWQQAQAG